MKDQLDRLEIQLERLVEKSITRWLGGKFSSPHISGQLSRAMTDGLRWDDQGNSYAPDRYALTLNPEGAERLLEESPETGSNLSKGLVKAARDCGYMLTREPDITIAADPTLDSYEARVVAWHSTDPVEFTQAMTPQVQTNPMGLPEGAFLIIDGGKHFPLDRPVINIGRRIDNQLILDDPHISRTHAQLRIRDGRFVLFDLGSTTGTIVNGRRITQHILRPGDVITVARVRLVYGEDPGGPPSATPMYTPPFPPQPAGDQRTYTDGLKPKSES